MQRNPRAYLICILLLPALAVLPAMAGSLPPLSPGPGDKCPVCGMFVAKYPDWVGEIIFTDGSVAFFDGAKDLFKYYFNLDKYKRIRENNRPETTKCC